MGSSLNAEFKSARERLYVSRFFFFLFSIVFCSHQAQAFQMSRRACVCVCVSKCGRRRKSHVCCSRKYRKRALFLNHDSNLQNTQVWLCTGLRGRASPRICTPYQFCQTWVLLKQQWPWGARKMGTAGGGGTGGGAVLRGPQQAD